MNTEHLIKTATLLNVGVLQVEATAKLLNEGATVPFIARYRKEATLGLDEVQIAKVRDELERLKSIDDRRDAIKKSLIERNLLTPELDASLNKADNLALLEDIYQPFKPKRRTKATIAKEKGLEPLALYLLENQDKELSDELFAEYINAEKEVVNAQEALAGAKDIIAEIVSDDSVARSSLREYFEKNSMLSSKVLSGKETEGAKFKDYFDWSEPASSAPSHRILAIRRGESEGFLSMRIIPEEEGAIALLNNLFVKSQTSIGKEITESVKDSYKRLLSSAIETHMRLEIKKNADIAAVEIFANNMRELLMASPLGSKNILAIDPGFRTGCKVVCLNKQGDLLHNDVIYPEQGSSKLAIATQTILGLCHQHKIEAIAIGNGTASRESEAFIKSLGLPKQIPIVMVNESGASIYSASEVAREEFPDHDITVRGAVSIGRRLMDPLAELVKIDPQSIGVGQYQHDVNQNLLKKTLDDVVVSCVNNVGVEVNTASKQLLSYVSGLNASTAANIVTYRIEKGAFKCRKDLMNVKGLGAKAFEQCAGFLRISNGDNPLDTSAVHPERYGIVERMAKDLNSDLENLIKSPELRAKIDLKKYVDGDLGMPTLQDILQELSKPGRDPREEFELFEFDSNVHSIDDLKEEMRLPGIVTNVTAFGAFVDIGVHQDGLVHISEMSDTFIKDASEVVKPGQKVNVFVLELDKERRRIALSMKSNPQKRIKSAGDMASQGDKNARFAKAKTFGSNRTPAPQRNFNSNDAFGNSFGNSLNDAFSKFGKK